ncbi:alanine racemase, partial [Pseudoalteromonas sp. S3785]|uniref:alanine racemase n=1 Tax=Pseudoalteromonas sp. S3785 TaxID=579545 RepID=UPI001284B2B5
MRLATAVFNLPAHAHNLSQLKHFALNIIIIAVLKANAFWHGLVKICHHLSSAFAFAVARID